MRIKSRLIVFLFLLGVCLIISRFGHALEAPWLSSNTATADSTSTLCGQFSIANGTNTIIVPSQGWLHGVVISSGSSSVNNTIQFYDSSWTVVSATSSRVIGPINITSVSTNPMIYDIVFRYGLSYVKTGLSTVQILYQCF